MPLAMTLIGQMKHNQNNNVKRKGRVLYEAAEEGLKYY